MSMVKFATLCDTPKCQRRSEEYSCWPACRSCGAHVCDKCEPKGTRREDDSDNSEGVAEMKVTVQCADCLESEGPDEWCTTPEEDTRDAAYERANREWGETHGGHL